MTTTAPTVKFYGVNLDSDRPAELGAFYAALFGVELTHSADEYAGFEMPGGAWLLVQKSPMFRRAGWQDPDSPQQLHLDLVVADLDAGQARAVELGATVADPQPQPDRWRVLIDPSGHPFCLTASMSG